MPTLAQITNKPGCNPMLTYASHLNTQQFTELDALCSDCKNTDGNIVAIYKHILSQNRPITCNILYYQQEQLAGFLSAFFFYEEACEIAVMVAPGSRRQGLATQMIREILPHLDAKEIKTLIFSTPNDLNNLWLSTQGFCYQNSEYQMHRLQSDPIMAMNKSLIIRPATVVDLPVLCSIDKACFPSPQPDMEMRLHHLLQDSNYRLFIAQIDGTPMGKAHIFWQENSAHLTDIAILPSFQGRGFGSEMLAHCINYCLTANQSNIRLDVETNNQHALNLYLRLGFVVNNAYDLWTIPIDTLKQRSEYQ